MQLLLAKSILPWFGGAASVWTTCMLFFQTLRLTPDDGNPLSDL